MALEINKAQAERLRKMGFDLQIPDDEITYTNMIEWLDKNIKSKINRITHGKDCRLMLCKLIIGDLEIISFNKEGFDEEKIVNLLLDLVEKFFEDYNRATAVINNAN